ncbi:hypothetical protein CUT44_25835 [Streptomyces carminius]|uniref:DUF3558 domain-containing protein n=1 Tax=Streptomyces carminius TaxID=2665496 RepID=A0A2M8LSY4_9ACTN|nr:hypothetical protein CUT44_25835 [Streptomyces carminius]
MLGVLIISLGAAACSAQERNYEIPSAMCGTAVSSGFLEPLLPPGEEISTTHSDRTEGMERCLVHVDDEQVLTFNIEWWREGTSLAKFASVVPNIDPGDKETEDGQYIYSDTGAVGKVACPRPRKTDGDLFVAVRVDEPGSPDEAAVQKLIAAYAEEVAKSDECT